MSGGTSGGYTGGGSGGEDCETVGFETALNSVVLAVLNQLQPGNVLEIALEEPGVTPTLVAKYNDNVAGSITSPQATRLLRCIVEGYNFNATVISNNGGYCKIRVAICD